MEPLTEPVPSDPIDSWHSGILTVPAEFALPQNPQPLALEVFEWLCDHREQPVWESEQYIPALNHYFVRLMQLPQAGPFIECVRGLLFYRLGNIECATLFMARSLRFQKPVPGSQKWFQDFLRQLGCPESAQEYLALAGQNVAELMRSYLRFARHHLQHKHWELYDEYVQRRNALKYANSPMNPPARLAKTLVKKRIEQVGYENYVSEWEAYRRRQFPDKSPDNFQWDESYLDCPNKQHAARFTTQILQRHPVPKQPVCLEIAWSSNLGALLHLLNQCARDAGYQPNITGMDPDPWSVDVAQRRFPELSFQVGEPEDLQDKRLSLPKQVDVLLLYHMFGMMGPVAAEQVLEFAAEHCAYLMIYDEFGNMDGAYPVNRRFYMLHPFQSLLKKYGFTIERVELADDPTIGMNAVLEAKNINKH